MGLKVIYAIMALMRERDSKIFHRIDSEDFYQLLSRCIVDEMHPFNSGFQEWEDCSNDCDLLGGVEG
jgi:hypothetical protein